MGKKKTPKSEKPQERMVPDLVYQSLFDEALNMAYTLQEIDQELRHAAQCEGDYPGGYPSEKLLPQLCKIMYADPGYWQADKYARPKKQASN